MIQLILKKTKCEIKAMNIVFYIPFILYFIVIIYCYLLSKSEEDLHFSKTALELFLPVLSGWWVNYYLSTYLEKEGGEVFFTYPISIIRLTLISSIKYLCIHIFFTILCFSIVSTFYQEIDFMNLVLLISQCVFYFSLSYFGICWLRTTSWNMFIIFTYLSVQLLTNGQLLKSINIHNFGFQGDVVILSLKSIVFGVVLTFAGQYLINNSYKMIKQKVKNK